MVLSLPSVSIDRSSDGRPRSKGLCVTTGSTHQLDKLATLLRDGLGPTAAVISDRDRQLAVELLSPDEQIRAVAMGRLQGRAPLTGQVYLATDARLIVSEAHRWKASWHRSLEWTQIRLLEMSSARLLIDLGDERLEIRSLMPLTAADQFEELRRRSSSSLIGASAADDVAVALAEQLPGVPAWMNDRAAHRLLQELQPGETLMKVMRFGIIHSGVVVLTDRRVGRLPDAISGQSAWLDRRDVSTVSLDDQAGLLLRTEAADLEWTGLIPADELPDLVKPLLADNRRRERAHPVVVDAPRVLAPSDLPKGVGHRQVQGVSVFWVDRPPSPRMSAHLFFGVGQADEPFLDGQITHLLEHVVMRRFADARYETNAGVGIWVTSFDVASRPATVAHHLRRVCETISSIASAGPDPADVESERAVLRAEQAQADGPGLSITLPAAAWFGRRGVGLVGESLVGLENADAQALTQWCRRWFVRGNAALVLDGPPPDDLVLPLPGGDCPPLARTSPRALVTPAWMPGPPGFQVSFRVRFTPVVEVLIQALVVRWTRLFRHDNGLVYSVQPAVIGLPGDEVIVSISADAAPQHAERITALLTADLTSLSIDGFDEADGCAAQDRLTELIEDPDWLVSSATDHAVRSIGRPAPPPILDSGSAGQITRDQLNQAWQAARETLLVATDVEIPDLPVLDVDREIRPVAGRTWTPARRGSLVIKGSSAVSGPHGVSLRWGPEENDDWRTVRYDQVVALGIDRLAPQDAVVVLFSRTGTLIGIRARDWRDGQHLVREILLAVPPTLHTYLPDQMRP